MQREELKEYKADENFGNGLVYSILEVNQVLDKNDAEIASLKAENEKLKQKLAEKDEEIYKQKWRGDEWAKACNQKDKEIESLKATAYADKVIAHQKYKRCLAMARWCEAELFTYPPFGTESPKEKWWQKWHKHWLKLAEKFKEAK